MRYRHDRTGELIEIDDEPYPPPFRPHDFRCRDGWLGEDADGRLIPCLTCRPHLADYRVRFARRLTGAA